VLVVDDNIFNLNVSEGLLGLMGIEAEMAESGYDAIELIGHKDYDVVFMDHMMPEMDGIETTLFIRGMGVKYKTLPIIALTANALSGAKEMFLSNGFNDFISKPIKTQELIRVLKDWIPPEKIQERTDDGNSGEPEHSAMEDELFRKSIVTFVKGNKDTMENLIDAIDLKDMKTAHRMAHTLKSSAGYLKLTKLQDAAASLEDSLHGKPPRYTSAQLDVLSKELESALHKYDYVLSESHSDNNEIEQIDKSELTSLLAELKPLLEKGNFDAVNYVNRLKGSEETKKLAELVDDFDFEGALRELSIINS
jgi:CheY-like chemotaxis protein